MAGHNKWSKVKHTKGPADQKRGRLFSKLSKEIALAARDGSGDPALNARLRQAINAAKAQSMPKDTIERAVKKGTGELDGNAYEEVLYEGYGVGGVALMVEIVTDNRNRAAADVRNIFSRNHGSLGTSGSVAYLFDRKGSVRVPGDFAGEERMLELALNAGAEDMETDDGEYVIYTAQDELAAVMDAFSSADVPVTSSGLTWIPQTLVPVSDNATASQVLRLYSSLDDYDDAQNVFANFDIPEEMLENIG